MGVSSGCGVSLYPFKKQLIANFEVRAIFHSAGEPQWKLNFNQPFLKREIRMEDLVDYGSPDVLVSSPDCGSGSILRLSRAKVYGDHQLNKSLKQFFDALSFLYPKFFLFENLEGLFNSYSEEEFRKKCHNYRLVVHRVSVSVFGNSQKNRKRLVIVGIRKDLPKSLRRKFRLPVENLPIRSCNELYGDLGKETNPEIGHFREEYDRPIAVYTGRKLTPRELRIEWKERLKGKTRYIVPASEGRKFSTAPGVYKNAKHGFPATARKSNRQFDHWGLMLSPRQIARIQGVPDEFGIYYEAQKHLYWLNKGRAVVAKTPPFEISLWFKERVEKTYKSWKNF